MREVVIFGISHRFRRLSQSEGQIAHVLLTRSPLVYSRKSLTARLACVKHAASVRPEPGSNSPLNSNDTHPQKEMDINSQMLSRQETESPTKIVGIIVSYQRNHQHNKQPQKATLHADGLKQTNSSTFDTLLSSQGSSAHHCQASRPDTRGNLQKLTGCDLRSQIRFLLPAPRRNTLDLGVPGPHRGAHPDHLG